MKILAVDLETTPMATWNFSLWNQNIGINQIEEPTRVMCFAARWYGDPKSKIMFWSEHHNTRADMIDEAWNLYDEADAVLHYNGKGFDTKHFNREFVQAGMAPPSPVKEIDLLTSIRRAFRFPSNKLDYISQALGIGQKTKHEGMGLWLKCMAGDSAAWARMEKYNKNDVHLLIDLYDRVLPWISGLPNLNLYNGTDGLCPKCGKDSLHKRGTRPSGLGLYQRYQCTSCGGWSTSGKSLERTDIRSES